MTVETSATMRTSPNTCPSCRTSRCLVTWAETRHKDVMAQRLRLTALRAVAAAVAPIAAADAAAATSAAFASRGGVGCFAPGVFAPWVRVARTDWLVAEVDGFLLAVRCSAAGGVTRPGEGA